MKEVVLIFPDAEAISLFLYDHPINMVEVNTKDQTVSSIMQAELVQIALDEYDAILIKDKWA